MVPDTVNATIIANNKNSVLGADGVDDESGSYSVNVTNIRNSATRLDGAHVADGMHIADGVSGADDLDSAHGTDNKYVSVEQQSTDGVVKTNEETDAYDEFDTSGAHLVNGANIAYLVHRVDNADGTDRPPARTLRAPQRVWTTTIIRMS